MSILVDEKSKILVQGITGRIGLFHAKEMRDYGSNIVGGVTPGKGGTTIDGFPVFNSVSEATNKTGADTSVIFVPGPFAADSIMEAAEYGIRYCVCITDGIPALDMVRVKRFMRRFKYEDRMLLTGPNCAGTISPGEALVGIMPGHIYKRGRVGVVSRSGTLGYEAAEQMKSLDIGISTSVGIGGDPINGASFKDILIYFNQDKETDMVLMIGEIGGPQETEAAHYIKTEMKKPVVSYIAGLSAPKGRRMGHAGAIVSTVGESAAEKISVLEAAGVTIAPNPSSFGETVQQVLRENNLL